MLKLYQKALHHKLLFFVISHHGKKRENPYLSFHYKHLHKLPYSDRILTQRRSAIIRRMAASRHLLISKPHYRRFRDKVPLVLIISTVRKHSRQKGKTNLSHDDLNPAHVPCWWVNNPTLGEFCFTMIGRADIEGSKSNVARNAWLPQASSSRPGESKQRHLKISIPLLEGFRLDKNQSYIFSPLLVGVARTLGKNRFIQFLPTPLRALQRYNFLQSPRGCPFTSTHFKKVAQGFSPYQVCRRSTYLGLIDQREFGFKFNHL